MTVLAPAPVATGRDDAGRLGRWLLAPAPPERSATLRILVGGFALTYLVARLPHFLGFADLAVERFRPIGVLWWLGSPLPPLLYTGLVVASVVAGAAFVTGWRFRLTAPAFAVLLLVVTTYRSSWGQVFHTDNLLVLHVAVLALAPAADALSLDARRRPAESPSVESPSVEYGWAVKVCAVLTVCTYVLAGWAKVRNGGWGWLAGDSLRNWVALDNVRKDLLGDVSSPFGAQAVRHGWVFAPLAAAALAVELTAPVALLGRRVRDVWVAAAWLFHVGIVALMAVTFVYPLSGVAFAPFYRVERLLPWVRAHAGLHRVSRRWRTA